MGGSNTYPQRGSGRSTPGGWGEPSRLQPATFPWSPQDSPPLYQQGAASGPALGHLTPIPALLVLNVTESPTCHQALPRSPPHLLTCPLLPLDLSLHFPGWPFPPFWFRFFSEHWAASEGEQRERAGREGPRGLAKAVPPVCSSLLPCSLWKDAHSSLGTPLYA